MKLHQHHSPGDFVINGYGDGFVQINGGRRENSVLLTADGAADADLPAAAASLTGAHLRRIADTVRAEVFLLGAGKTAPPYRAEWIAPFAAAGISLEIMSLPAACRTYNILQGDGRTVAAILIIPG
ncbi:MAG: Mth938-like domain-containing protein [Gammaproteobacteria bacterium]